MSSFPNEVWDLVFFHIDDRCLQDVACVSKTFEYLTRRHRFWQLVLFTALGDLTEAISHIAEVLKHTASHEHVRELDVRPRAVPPDYEDSWIRYREEEYDLEPWQWANTLFRDATEQQQVQIKDFIATLPQLRDLHWRLMQRIPQAIVRGLDNRQRLCRLHIYAFYLRSLPKEVGMAYQLSPEDMELATSKSLSTVCFIRFTHDTYEIMSYALKEMIAGAAPNLKSVSYATREPIVGTRVLDFWRTGTLESESGSLGCSKGALMHIDLGGPDVEEELRHFHHRTDFTKLVSLAVWKTIDATTITWLRSLDFDSLKHLKLSAKSPGYAELILGLKPLSTLRLRHAVDAEHLGSIILHSNLSLTFLRLEKTFLTVKQINHIGSHCPNLKHLACHAWRKRGSAEELAVYSAIGQLAKVRTVQLHLDQPDDLNTTSVQHSISILQNFAMDAQLAADIFKFMASAKQPFAQPLEGLQLVMNAIQVNDEMTMLRELVVYVGRSWTCWYDPQSPTECTTAMFFERDFDCVDSEDGRWEEQFEKIMETSLGAALLRLWPDEPDSQELLDWHSLPLQTEGAADRSTINKRPEPRSLGSRMLRYCSSFLSWGLDNMTSYSS